MVPRQIESFRPRPADATVDLARLAATHTTPRADGRSKVIPEHWRRRTGGGSWRPVRATRRGVAIDGALARESASPDAQVEARSRTAIRGRDRGGRGCPKQASAGALRQSMGRGVGSASKAESRCARAEYSGQSQTVGACAVPGADRYCRPSKLNSSRSNQGLAQASFVNTGGAKREISIRGPASGLAR
jgi:hypothetical protein